MPSLRPALAAAALSGALALATPATAQQYWLPNGPGGTTWNNPQGSWSGTVYENMLQRRAFSTRNGIAPPGEQAPAPRQVAPAASGDPTFRLINRSQLTVNEVYVSSSHDNGWGPDRLGANVLPGGHRIVVRLPMGQCLNDIRVVYANGQAIERRQVNTCALTDYAVP